MIKAILISETMVALISGLAALVFVSQGNFSSEFNISLVVTMGAIALINMTIMIYAFKYPGKPIWD